MYEIAEHTANMTFSNPDVSKKLHQSRIIINFKYRDDERWGPDAVPELTVDCTKDPVEIIMGPCDLKATIEMSMDAFTAHLFWMQKLQIMSAITRGQIKAKGPISKAMRLLPVLKPFYTQLSQDARGARQAGPLNFPPD